MSQKIIKAVLVEIGQIKQSTNWTNIYLKFRNNNGKELWYYYSEHVSKPARLKQIPDFKNENICRVGMTMDVTYEVKQSENKSTTLNIKSLANYQLKKFFEGSRNPLCKGNDIDDCGYPTTLECDHCKFNSDGSGKKDPRSICNQIKNK